MPVTQTMLAVVTVVALTSCAVSAPQYHPSLRSVEAFRRNAGPVAMGEFLSAPGLHNPSLRLSEMRSPVGGDFAAYLRDAVSQELSLAGRLAQNSKVVLSATLLDQSVDASPTPRSGGSITAEFSIVRAGVITIRRTYTAGASWDSSFFGAHAVGKAQAQYLFLVQSLIKAATDDPEFLQALRPIES
jgi:hypothetical protein